MQSQRERHAPAVFTYGALGESLSGITRRAATAEPRAGSGRRNKKIVRVPTLTKRVPGLHYGLAARASAMRFHPIVQMEVLDAAFVNSPYWSAQPQDEHHNNARVAAQQLWDGLASSDTDSKIVGKMELGMKQAMAAISKLAARIHKGLLSKKPPKRKSGVFGSHCRTYFTEATTRTGPKGLPYGVLYTPEIELTDAALKVFKMIMHVCGFHKREEKRSRKVCVVFDANKDMTPVERLMGMSSCKLGYNPLTSLQLFSKARLASHAPGRVHLDPHRASNSAIYTQGALELGRLAFEDGNMYPAWYLRDLLISKMWKDRDYRVQAISRVHESHFQLVIKPAKSAGPPGDPTRFDEGATVQVHFAYQYWSKKSMEQRQHSRGFRRLS